jgi:hypothetical protein
MSSPPHQHLDSLRESVEEQEHELHVALEELEGAARRAFDMRRWIRSRPLLWIGGAFLAGAWLGAQWPAHRNGARR